MREAWSIEAALCIPKRFLAPSKSYDYRIDQAMPDFLTVVMLISIVQQCNIDTAEKTEHSDL